MALWPLCLPYIIPFAALVRANAYERQVRIKITEVHADGSYRYTYRRIRGPLQRDDSKPLTRRQRRALAFEQAKIDQREAADKRRLDMLREIKLLEAETGTAPVTD
jgi:hypothetical protein